MATTHLAALFALLMAIVSVEGENKKGCLSAVVHPRVELVHTRAKFKVGTYPCPVCVLSTLIDIQHFPVPVLILQPRRDKQALWSQAAR